MEFEILMKNAILIMPKMGSFKKLTAYCIRGGKYKCCMSILTNGSVLIMNNYRDIGSSSRHMKCSHDWTNQLPGNCPMLQTHFNDCITITTYQFMK